MQPSLSRGRSRTVCDRDQDGTAPACARISNVETATQTLHRLTSIDRRFADRPGSEWTPPVDDPRVVQGFEANDLARFPWFFKRYEGSLPRLSLPRSLPTTTAPAVAVLAGTPRVGPRPLDLPQLSRLSHL